MVTLTMRLLLQIAQLLQSIYQSEGGCPAPTKQISQFGQAQRGVVGRKATQHFQPSRQGVDQIRVFRVFVQHVGQWNTKPPLTGKSCPVIKSASSDNRKTTVPVTSSGTCSR